MTNQHFANCVSQLSMKASIECMLVGASKTAAEPANSTGAGSQRLRGLKRAVFGAMGFVQMEGKERRGQEGGWAVGVVG